MHKTLTIVGATALAFVSQTVNAVAITQYSDRTAFEAAAGNLSSENFNSFSTDASFQNSPLDVGPFTITYNGTLGASWNLIDVSPFVLSIIAPNNTPFMNGGVLNDETIVLTFDHAITAFGADFTALNDDIARSIFSILGQTLTVPVQNGITTLFFGVVSDTPFTSVTLTGLPSSEGYGMDNVAYSARVPVAGTLPLLAIGLAGIGAMRRKKLAA